MSSITLKTTRPAHICTISVVQDATRQLIRTLRSLHPTSCMIVTDTNVQKLHGKALQNALQKAGFTVHGSVIASGEKSKTMKTFAQLTEFCFAKKLDRHSVIIALGGGVVGDLAGFVAATYMRGIRYIAIPTTLLAMVDSSIGGKTGINLPQGKNVCGAFHQPDSVIIDAEFLATLSDRQIATGMAEIIKYGVIADPSLFTQLERSRGVFDELTDAELLKIITRCAKIKTRIVARDERETTGLRQMLNYGHTFGHALETLTGYDKLSHGEAISIGMHCAALVALRRKMVNRHFVDRQKRLLETFGLPTNLFVMVSGVEPRSTINEIVTLMSQDKKNLRGKVRLILPRRIGTVAVSDITTKELISVLTSINDT